MKDKPSLRLPLVILGLFVLLAFLAPWLSSYNPSEQDLAHELHGPSAKHVLGQDQNGCDVWSHLVFGARVSLLVAGGTVVISFFIGVFLGVLAGYRGGKIDAAFLWLSDIVLAFPGLLLAIGISAMQSKPSVGKVIFALCATGWVSYARLSRGLVLKTKTEPFVQALSCLGIPHVRILWRHILPNLMPALFVQASFGAAGAIIAESTLSFLGLGVPPEIPSWGSMLDAGTQYLFIAPHLSIAPGIAILSVVLTFHLLGEGLRVWMSHSQPG